MCSVPFPLALALAIPAQVSAAPPVVEVSAMIERVTPLTGSVRLEPSANVSAYANLANFWGFSLIHGGVASNGVDTSTLFVADDLVPDPAYGGARVTAIRFTVSNYNPVPVTIRTIVGLLNPDGPSGQPGSLILGIVADGLIVQPVTVSVIVLPMPPGRFSMPGGPFWAGLSFDDADGGWSVTPSQLSNLGQGYFGPPTVGSSQNRLFITSTPFTLDGTILTRTGTPAYDFGWEFEVDDSTPTRLSTWGRLKTLYR